MTKFQLKWGILATGGIAETFARDLWVNPEVRGVNDIEHVVVAAASSSYAKRAQDFLKEVRAPDGAKAYGSYKELAEDPNVNIIYVATPHSHHYQNVRLCLGAGKNVLCEKAFTTNAAQLEKLIEIAKSKNLFLMEAVWTRYFPLSIYVRDIITSGKLGQVVRTTADLSIGTPPEDSFPDTHRMVNLDLAGGALLDLGIYALTWVFQTLYHTQKDPQPPTVSSAATKYKTGADESVSMLLNFPLAAGGSAHGIATASMRTSSDPDKKGTAGPAIRIQGQLGEMIVFAPAYRPTKTRLVLQDGTVEDKSFDHPGAQDDTWVNGFGSEKQPKGQAQGMYWEADECAFAIRDGRKEGKYEPLQESLVIMKVMDEVRKQNDLKFPDKIETLDYPVDL